MSTADRALRRVPLPPPVKRRLARLRLRHATAVVEIDRFLLGGENGMSAAEYARAVDDLMRPSTPIAEWPHVRLLQAYATCGESVLLPDAFRDTPYSRNAHRCVQATGHYFGATTDEEIRQVATDFVHRYAGGAAATLRPSQSRADDPIRVRPVRRSRYFEVVDGHHRLAAAFVEGQTVATVAVERRQVWTPLQALLREMSWLEGKLELYQPLDAPELAEGWTQVRKCYDRMGKMRAFLDERSLLEQAGSYLDVASCYGWFVAQMQDLGFDAHGMERDPLGAVLAEQVYGVRPGRIAVGDCAELLPASESTFDVVSCFSLLHHFVLGRGSCSAERLIELIDRTTGRVLFFDTGQGTEAWFRSTLPDWDADHVERWLGEHTSFDEIVRLGPDEDAVAPFEDNYGRMLFACVRSPGSGDGQHPLQ